MTGRAAAISFGAGLRFDQIVSPPGRSPRAAPQHAWSKPLRRRLGIRGPAHSLLADSSGVWAWSALDSHAAATRHASVRQWMESHAGRDMRIWVSAELTRNVDGIASTGHLSDDLIRAEARRALIADHGRDAEAWPLATWKNDSALGALALVGIDLDSLRAAGVRHDVRMQSVSPWWYHAFVEAKRCVHALNHFARAQICVVEGLQVTWIVARFGVLSEVRHLTLGTASVDALQGAIDRMSVADSRHAPLTVTLGQGLADGGQTRRLNALVLGRLDGAQPPQWLRPAAVTD